MDDGTLLQRYHAQPGQTHATIGDWRDEGGRTSYEVLAQETDALPRGARVLDLACGDGYLLDLLARRGLGDLAGVDRSPEELSAARARLGARAALFCEDAGALSLPTGSVDAVVSHLALMLMAPLAPVLAEVSRVLRPGGLFAAVVQRPLHDPVTEVYRRELPRVTAEAGLGRLVLGDPRAFSTDGLREVLRAHPFDQERLSFQDFAVRRRAAPAELWPTFALMYDVFRLPDPFRATLEQRVKSGWETLADEGGMLGCALGMRLVIGHREASSAARRA